MLKGFSKETGITGILWFFPFLFFLLVFLACSGTGWLWLLLSEQCSWEVSKEIMDVCSVSWLDVPCGFWRNVH